MNSYTSEQEFQFCEKDLDNIMKKRHFQRNSRKQTPSSIMNVKQKVSEYAEHAINGEDSIESFGNFILLSSSSGTAWLLDPRESLALRLADHYERLQHTILETPDKFSVEWTEKYRIEGDTFIAYRGDKQSIFWGYPIDML